MVYTSETPRDVYKLLMYSNLLRLNSTYLLKIYKLLMRKSLQKASIPEVIVHAPEQFDGDFILDLFSDEQEVTDKTVYLLNKIFAKAKKLTINRI